MAYQQKAVGQVMTLRRTATHTLVREGKQAMNGKLLLLMHKELKLHYKELRPCCSGLCVVLCKALTTPSEHSYGTLGQSHKTGVVVVAGKVYMATGNTRYTTNNGTLETMVMTGNDTQQGTESHEVYMMFAPSHSLPPGEGDAGCLAEGLARGAAAGREPCLAQGWAGRRTLLV